MASDAHQERIPLVEPEGEAPEDGDKGDKPSLIARLGSERRTRRLYAGGDEARARAGRAPDDRPGAEDPLDEAPGDEGGRPRGPLLPILIALLALVGFGAVVWYAYTWGVGGIQDEQLPVVRAEPDPIKVRPVDPGGLQVPDQDKLVLNEPEPDPARPQVERLLPPPETPLPPEPLQGEAAAGEESGDAATPAPADEGESGTAPLAAPVIDAEPKAVEEPKLPPPPAAETTAPAEPAKPAEPVETAAGPAPPAKQAEPAGQAGAEQAAALPPAGGFVVQLASLKSGDRVDAVWADMQKAHPSLLGDRRLVVQTVELGSRGTYHRVQAGMFPDRASAQALCDRLKAREQDCLVAQR